MNIKQKVQKNEQIHLIRGPTVKWIKKITNKEVS